MKIVNTNRRKTVPFNSLKRGDCFLYCDVEYMKTSFIINSNNIGINVVSLNDGCFDCFPEYTLVTPLPDATLTY